MNLNSISKKEILTDSITGEQKVRMTMPVYKLKATVTIIAYHEVRGDDEMRPDLISLKHYGTPEYADIILKANGISNPFSIKAGMVLSIPDKDSAERFTKNFNKVSSKPRTQFTDPNRMTQQDKARKDFLQQKSASKKNGSKENLPPNMLKSDQIVKLIKDNKILLGANINTNNRNR